MGELDVANGGLSVHLDHVQLAAPPDSEPAARAFFGDDQFVAAVKAHVGFRVSPAQLRRLTGALVDANYPVLWAPAGEIPGTQRLYTTDPWGSRLELLADNGSSR